MSRRALRFERLTPEGADTARFRYHVPADSPYFDGHFVGDPILPGVAQISDIVVDRVEALWPELGAPVEIPRMKFSLPIRPGDDLDVTLTHRTGEESVRFSITVKGEPASAGQLRYRSPAP